MESGTWIKHLFGARTLHAFVLSLRDVVGRTRLAKLASGHIWREKLDSAEAEPRTAMAASRKGTANKLHVDSGGRCCKLGIDSGIFNEGRNVCGHPGPLTHRPQQYVYDGITAAVS